MHSLWQEFIHTNLPAGAAGEKENNQDGGCQGRLTHADATAFCTSVGGRLCTAEELEAECTQGCGDDNDLIWSSSAPREPEVDEQCAAEADGLRRRRRLGATKADLRRRMSESDCPQPAELNQDGAQSSAGAVSNVMDAAANASVLAEMEAEQARIEEQRLQRIADCRTDCEDQHPPVTKRRCKHDRRRRRLEEAYGYDDYGYDDYGYDDYGYDEDGSDACTEWECFEYGEPTCTEYWTEDAFCASRCEVSLYNGGFPSWAYDPYVDVVQPCSRICGTWRDHCCVTEGVRCVDTYASSASGARRLQAAESPVTQTANSFFSWLCEVRWFVGTWLGFARVATEKGNTELTTSLSESSVEASSGSRQQDTSTLVQRLEPGKLSGRGYVYSSGRAHTYESQDTSAHDTSACSSEAAACIEDDGCSEMFYGTAAADMADCTANARCAALNSCLVSESMGSGTNHSRSGRRQLRWWGGEKETATATATAAAQQRTSSVVEPGLPVR